MSSPFIQAFSNRRIAVTLLLMFASSFPLPLTGTGTTFQNWLIDYKVDIKTLGLLAWVGIPYSLKFLWAPLLDRYVPPFLGRRTGWISIFLGLLILLIGSMGFLNPSENIGVVVAFAFAIAFCSASQDIVIDAYRVDLLRPEERGAGASMVMLGGRLAFLASGSLALVFADHLSWEWVWVGMAACLLVGLPTCYFAPSPEVAVVPPKSLREAVIEPLKQYFRRDGAVIILLFVIFYKLGDTLAGALLSRFLRDIGFEKTDIGVVSKVWGLIASLVGGVIAGGTVTRFGVYRSLWVFGILQAVSNFVFIMLAFVGKSYPWLVASIGVEQFCGGLGTAAFVAYLMGLCDRRFSATQYALLSSLMSLSRTVFSGGTGYMIDFFGWQNFFVVTALLAVPGLVLLKFIKKYDEAPPPTSPSL